MMQRELIILPTREPDIIISALPYATYLSKIIAIDKYSTNITKYCQFSSADETY